MSERSSPPPAGAGDHAVLEYLAAVETRRAVPSTHLEPDRIVDNLASADMMQPTDDPEELRRQLGKHTPSSEDHLERLEEGFVAGAKEYARRHGVGYEAWIQSGVDPVVLHRAGIHPDPE
jgi:hypothetical protein